MTIHLRTVAQPQQRLFSARLAASTLFTIVGAATGTWTARMPTIEQRLNLSHGQLSVALLALALGGLAGMSLTGRLVDRFGTQRVLAPAAVALGPALGVLVWAPTFLTLVAALFLFGLAHGTTNVSMNAYAVACETAYGRPIMSSIHAWFSIGGLLAAAGGAAFSAADPTANGTFTTAGALSLVLVSGALLAARHAQIDGMITTASCSSVPTARRPALVPFWRMAGLGLIAFCSLLCEGATADWSSVYLHDSLHGSLGISASAYAVFALAMTGGRLTADRLVARFGPATVLRACGLLATGGFTAGAVTGAPLAAVAGFGLLGAGLSCVVPQVYSAAGHLDADNAGGVLSKVAALGYSGFVIGPVLIGALAEQAGLAAAMLLLPVLTLVVAVSGSLVRTRESWRRNSATAIRT